MRLATILRSSLVGVSALVVSAQWASASVPRSIYAVTGPHTAFVCAFGLICHVENINAVRRPDGRLYALPTSYPAVSEYNEHTKRCFIRTDAGFVAKLISYFRNEQPTFLFVTPGKSAKRVSPEYVTFACTRR